MYGFGPGAADIHLIRGDIMARRRIVAAEVDSVALDKLKEMSFGERRPQTNPTDEHEEKAKYAGYCHGGNYFPRIDKTLSIQYFLCRNVVSAVCLAYNYLSRVQRSI